MLRKVIIVFIITTLAITTYSQGFSGGLLAGMSATQVDGDGYGGYHRAGLAAGVWVGRSISPELAIRSELKSAGYLWKASESNMDGPYPEEDVAQFRKVEVAATAGVEYIINNHFSFCASFSYSAFPVRPHKGDISYRLNRGQFNNALQFYLKYNF
jgi:hypothetical protein